MKHKAKLESAFEIRGFDGHPGGAARGFRLMPVRHDRGGREELFIDMRCIGSSRMLKFYLSDKERL